LGTTASPHRYEGSMMSSSYPLSPLRILYVEDHPDTANACLRLMEMRGFRVMLARDWHSAIDLARRFPFDLLLCDLELPDGDGRTLLTKLRGELGMDNLRAIAYSAHGMADVVESAKAAGFDAHILKPTNMADEFIGAGFGAAIRLKP
jgi:CheY-like chemotaxis protein